MIELFYLVKKIKFRKKLIRQIQLFALLLLFAAGMFCWLFFHPIRLSFDLEIKKNCSATIFCESDNHIRKLYFEEFFSPAKKHYKFICPWWTDRIRLRLGCYPDNQLTIRNLKVIKNGFFSKGKETLTISDIQQSFQVAEDGNGFKTTGRRPQIDFSLSLLSVSITHSLLLALNFLIGVFILLLVIRAMSSDHLFVCCRWFDPAVSGWLKIRKYCIENRNFLIYIFCCLMIFFGYELFQAPISQDDACSLLVPSEQIYGSRPGKSTASSEYNLAEIYISNSKWTTAAAVQKYVGFVPVVSLVWTLLCLSVLFLILTEKLKLSKEARYLLFPLFIGHPIYYEYLSSYMTTNIFGMLFLINFLAVFFCLNARNWRNFFLLILISVFTVSSLQALIVVFPLWFLLTKMSDNLDRPINFKQFFTDLLKLIGSCLLVLLGCILILKVIHHTFNVQYPYYPHWDEYLKKPDLLKMIWNFRFEFLQKILTIYSGGTKFTIHGQLLLFLSMMVAIIIHMIRKKRSLANIAMMATALAIIQILPFTLNIVLFNADIPAGSILSFPLMMLGLCILGWRSLEYMPKTRLAASLLIILVSLQYGIFSNQSAFASDLRHKQDWAVVQSIKDRCYQISEFTAKVAAQESIPLAVIGNLIEPKRRIFPMWNDSLLNQAYEPSLVIHLHMMGETYFYPVSAEGMKRIFPIAMKMPCWPSSGSVRYEGGIMIVKLSEFNEHQCRLYGFPFRPDIKSPNKSSASGQIIPDARNGLLHSTPHDSKNRTGHKNQTIQTSEY